MPYLKSQGLIFIAIPKTGSTSMAAALRGLCPPGERLQLLNELIDKAFRQKYRLDEIGDKKPGRGKHLSALQAKYILGDEEFNRCIKFSLVRNPWARMVSRYYFTHIESEPSDTEKIRRGTTRTFHNLTFEKWITKQWIAFKGGKKRAGQIAKLVDAEGNMLVDHVGRLENVQDTLDWVSERLGAARVVMPYVNGTRKRGHYSQIYNDRTRDMVAEICRKDIDYFNYQFEEC